MGFGLIYVFVFLDKSEERVDRIVGWLIRSGPNLIVCKGIVGFSKGSEPGDKDSFEELCVGSGKILGAKGGWQ